MIPDVALELMNYLESKRTDIVGKSDITGKLKFITRDFNPDTGTPAIMVRSAGGPGRHVDIQSMAISYVQVWARATKPDQANLLMRKIDNLLHRYGPEQMTDEMYVWHMAQNTDIQSMDDPDTKFAQYFCVYEIVYRGV